MKQGLNLNELAAEITRRANAKKDFIVKTGALEMTQDTQPGVALMFGGQRAKLNTIAHQQVAEYTDIPKKYYDRMLTAAPALLATNVNNWLAAAPDEKRMVRTLDGTARAFLSDRYRPLENEELATAVLPVIRDLELEVMSSQITERRFYLKCVDKSVARELEAIGGKFGDGQHKIVRCLSPAITISNSEVGMGALSVLGGVYDGFCSNLATFGERSVRRYHVGAKHQLAEEEIYTLLSDNTRKLTDAATWAQVRDVVKAAFDKAKFDSLCEKISETQGQKIEGDPVQTISLAARKLDMTETEGTAILRHLIEGGDLSRFGLYNAVTRMAQDVEDYDRATELERIGAKIIELPRHDWQELAKAA